MQHCKGDAIEHEPLIAASRVPRNPPGSQRVEEFIVHRVRDLFPGFEDERGREAVEYTRHTAEMIGVGMRDDQRRKLPHSAAHQKRHEHFAAGIAITAAWACIDNNPPARRCSYHGAVALTHVEKM